jgi:hypothetical protein|nr:MAG TPA: Protein of unknown function (DUF3090) [Caudoviricetes sp.]
MAIPDYADERAFNRFSKGFVGSSHGDNGTSYRTSWNTQCDAEPTKMILTHGRPVCAYCGNMGLALQPNIERFRDYDVVGYTCVCKGAMDEEEWRHELSEMENNHYEELQALKRREPRTNPDVIKGIITRLTSKLEEAKTMSEVQDILEQLKAVREE